MKDNLTTNVSDETQNPAFLVGDVSSSVLQDNNDKNSNEAQTELLFKKREILIEKLAYYNNPSMFNTRNYEPHKNRIRKRLREIGDILHKELNVDKRYYAF